MAANLNAVRKLSLRCLLAALVLLASFALDGPAREAHGVVLAAVPGWLLWSVAEAGNPATLTAMVVAFLAAGLVARRSRLTRAAAVLAGALVGTGLVVLSLKWLASRSEDGVFHGFWAGEQGIMFPSGHTALAFAACAVIGAVWRKLRWPAYGIAAGVALSQVILVHFLSDVVTGALIGVLVAKLVTGWAARKGFLTLDSGAPGTRSPAPEGPAPGG